MTIRRFSSAILVALGLFMYWQMFARLPGLSGDASIYWTFARSMWEQGVFYFGEVGPKHGATSPLWAFVLSLVHLVSPHWYEGFQGLSVVLTGGTAISTGLVVRRLTKSTIAGLMASDFVLLSVPLHRYSSGGYDTGLITFTMAEAVRTTILLNEKPSLSRWVHWGLVLSLLPLARPEGVVFFPILAAWTAYCVGLKQDRIKAFLVTGFCAGLPALFFYTWMYSQTGHFVPTSVQGRDLVHAAADSYWPPVPMYALIYRNFGGLVAPEGLHASAFAVVWMSLVAIGAVQLFYARRQLAILLGSLPTALFLMMCMRNPSYYMIRYSLPVLMIGVVFASYGLAWIAARIQRLSTPWKSTAGWAGVAVGSFLALAPIQVICQRAHLPKEATIADVLDVSGTEIVNRHLDADDVAIVYEIQTQYWLKCQTIAGSGIVGGEIFRYLASKDIEELRKIGVTHIFLSNAFDYRSIFDGTVMEHLWNVNDDVAIGTTVEFQGMRLKKILARDFQIMKPHWIAVYEVL